MSDEPTNEQLANFIVIYGRTNPLLAGLSVNPAMLELIFEHDEVARQRCLEIHQKFQARIAERGIVLQKKIEEGTLPCEYIRPNGKPCPNFNEPGSLYCGLHQDKEE